MELKAKEVGRKKKSLQEQGEGGREGSGGAEWDKLVKETMVALWFMF